jgi:hypothetical protein
MDEDKNGYQKRCESFGCAYRKRVSIGQQNFPQPNKSTEIGIIRGLSAKFTNLHVSVFWEHLIEVS